jgi:hypothetical protein
MVLLMNCNVLSGRNKNYHVVLTFKFKNPYEFIDIIKLICYDSKLANLMAYVTKKMTHVLVSIEALTGY